MLNNLIRGFFMSAFLCTNTHITALAVFATNPTKFRQYPLWKPDLTALERYPNKRDSEILGELLLKENLKSINYRYPDHSFIEGFKLCHVADNTQYTPVQMIKLAQCYDYQSCEHPEYKGCIAQRLMDSIISDCIRMLPGYDEAPWGLDYQNGNLNRKKRGA